MVIVSNEWMSYDDTQKQSHMIDSNVMMATPSVPPATVPIDLVGDGNVLNSAIIAKGEATTVLNDPTESEEVTYDNLARIVLTCQPNSHPFQTRTILLAPNIECKVGRSIAKSKASENNAIFDCKVLSRNHAVLWYSDDGKFYVRDTKSSNGTFINDQKINPSEPVEFGSGDVVKFGVEVTENSRNEVHGCIIASIKPYLPDGKESFAIKKGKHTTCADSRISFDELLRLNTYMQETSQRERLLKSKLQNMQNILDATRKNSTICWQSMIDEDRLLNRIDVLEKKLQFLQKNSTSDLLKEEILKLQDEKFLYQNSAKEALRKVYQERMDALQKLSKMERDYTYSEHECLILREQIRCTKQSLHDVNCRLMRLEQEYNEFKEQIGKSKQETNVDTAASDLLENLKKKEAECNEYKKQIGELLLFRAQQLEEDQKNHMEKLGLYDASTSESVATTDSSVASTLAGDIIDNDENNVHDTDISSTDNGRKSTIMKWLENSDLNLKEDSVGIMNAICNEAYSNDTIDSDDRKNEYPTKTNSTTELKIKLQNVAKKCMEFETELMDIKTNSSCTETCKIFFDNQLHPLLTLLQETLSEIEISQPINHQQSKLQEESINDYQYTVQDQTPITSSTSENLESECEILKEKVNELTKELEGLHEEKSALEKVIAENKSNTTRSLLEIENEEEKDFDKLIEYETVALNSAGVRSEEELIIYKDKFAMTQAENLNLKREIIELKLKSDNFLNNFFRKALTYGAVFIGIFLYFIFLYF